MVRLLYASNYLAYVKLADEEVYLFLVIVTVLLLALYLCIKLTKKYKVYDLNGGRIEHSNNQDSKASIQV